MTNAITLERALRVLVAAGHGEQGARSMLSSLTAAGFELAEQSRDELVCRWIDVRERPVPPEADTIIRTITKTYDGGSSSTTHWLDGLRAPLIARQ
jgi:hypothetical protein